MRETWQTWTGGLHVCMGLVFKSAPFDAGQTVECKFDISPCHGLKGGRLQLWLDPAEADQYEVGAEFSIRIREL